MKKHIYILGINVSDHDRSVCLVKDGVIAYAIANERLDRRKYSAGSFPGDPSGNVELPSRALVYCLRNEGIGINDVDLIVVGRSIYSPRCMAQQTIPVRDPEKIVEIPFPGHHLSHALSAYYCSPFKEAAVVVVDQMGSFIQLNPMVYEKHSIYHCKGTRVDVVKKYYGSADDLSLGLFYDYCTNGFEFVRPSQLWGNAGKLMGLSSYGRPDSAFPKLITLAKGNTIILKNPIRKFFRGLGLEIDPRKIFLNGSVSGTIFKLASHTETGRKIAWKAQDELERAMAHIVDYAYAQTRCENLCLAGGVALNCAANGKLVRGSRFKNIFIQPGGMDDGTAIGLALYGWHHVLKKKKRFILRHAYLGAPYQRSHLQEALREYPFSRLKKYFKRQDTVWKTAARYIAAGKIIGWYQGASEFGPRALGHRSILADPRRDDFRDILNKKKGRELFRPFAASVVLERCGDFFDLKTESPFMLIAAPVHKHQRLKVPAIVHVDGTSRLQTVTHKDNGIFYFLIKEFEAITGIPLVLNTSFNANNEPLVETPRDAIKAFFAMDLDYLVIGDYLVSKEDISVPDADVIRTAIHEGMMYVPDKDANMKKAVAIADYTERQRKELIHFRLQKAHALARKKQYGRALKEYRGILSENTDAAALSNENIHVAVGSLYLALGRYRMAIKEFKKQEAGDPDSPEVKLLLAQCYRAINAKKETNSVINEVADILSRRA